jgi:type IV secretory pathway protease TraF
MVMLSNEAHKIPEYLTTVFSALNLMTVPLQGGTQVILCLPDFQIHQAQRKSFIQSFIQSFNLHLLLLKGYIVPPNNNISK